MRSLAFACVLLVPTAAWSRDAAYPAEAIYDTRIFADEAPVNVGLANHRWPDCKSNRTAIQNIFWIEGARSDQDKALALWKWFRLPVAATGGGYMYEGEPPGDEELAYDPHIILTVYGHHQRDGLNWSWFEIRG